MGILGIPQTTSHHRHHRFLWIEETTGRTNQSTPGGRLESHPREGRIVNHPKIHANVMVIYLFYLAMCGGYSLHSHSSSHFKHPQGCSR